MRAVLQCGGHPWSHSTNNGLRRLAPRAPASTCNPVVRLVSACFCASASILLMSRGPLFASGVLQSRRELWPLGKDGCPGVGVSGSRRKERDSRSRLGVFADGRSFAPPIPLIPFWLEP